MPRCSRAAAAVAAARSGAINVRPSSRSSNGCTAASAVTTLNAGNPGSGAPAMAKASRGAAVNCSAAIRRPPALVRPQILQNLPRRLRLLCQDELQMMPKRRLDRDHVRVRRSDAIRQRAKSARAPSSTPKAPPRQTPRAPLQLLQHIQARRLLRLLPQRLVQFARRLCQLNLQLAQNAAAAPPPSRDAFARAKSPPPRSPKIAAAARPSPSAPPPVGSSPRKVSASAPRCLPFAGRLLQVERRDLVPRARPSCCAASNALVCATRSASCRPRNALSRFCTACRFFARAPADATPPPPPKPPTAPSRSPIPAPPSASVPPLAQCRSPRARSALPDRANDPR